MIPLLFFLLGAMIAAAIYFRHQQKLAMLDAFANKQKKSKKRNNIRGTFQATTLIQNKRALVILSLVFAGIGGFVFVSMQMSALIGAMIFATFPYLAITQWFQFYKKRYRKDAKRAIDHAAAIFRSGGSISDWIRDVVPRLEGPLRPQFEQGAQSLLLNISAAEFLESLIDRCPDTYFQFVFAGLAQNEKNAGDLDQYMTEVQDDLVSQERFESSMGEMRKRAQRVFSFVIVFPIGMYLMFKGTVNYLLSAYPSTNIGLMVGTAGYFVVLYFIRRVTQAEMT